MRLISKSCTIGVVRFSITQINQSRVRFTRTHDYDLFLNLNWYFDAYEYHIDPRNELHSSVRPEARPSVRPSVLRGTNLNVGHFNF